MGVWIGGLLGWLIWIRLCVCECGCDVYGGYSFLSCDSEVPVLYRVVFVWARMVRDDVFVVLSFLGPIMRNDVNENENGNFDFVVYDFLSLLSGVICWVMSCFVSYWSFLMLNCLYGCYWVRYRIFFKSDYRYFISF